MMITTASIIGFAGLLAAVIAIGRILATIYEFIRRQNEQDAEITDIKTEQRILTEGLLATLDGLEQLGCNHSVPTAKRKIEEHLNNVAHK